jgi:hypothetical protein
VAGVEAAAFQIFNEASALANAALISGYSIGSNLQEWVMLQPRSFFETCRQNIISVCRSARLVVCDGRAALYVHDLYVLRNCWTRSGLFRPQRSAPVLKRAQAHAHAVAPSDRRCVGTRSNPTSTVWLERIANKCAETRRNAWVGFSVGSRCCENIFARSMIQS